MTPQVEVLPSAAADDDAVVVELARLINRAYALGESGTVGRRREADRAGGGRREEERLRAWYARLGYRSVRSAPFEEVATHGASELATPCEFLVFSKPLSP